MCIWWCPAKLVPGDTFLVGHCLKKISTVVFACLVIVLTPRVERPKQGWNTPPIAESTSRSKCIDQTPMAKNRFKHYMQGIESGKLNKNYSQGKTGQTRQV
jgi:hypothetical protein